MKYSISILVTFLLISFSIFSQKTIKGKITDENGDTLPGVTIQEKGTTNGLVADFDGNYQITVTGDNSILVFTYLGFKTQEIQVNGQTVVNVKMIVDSTELDEIVVIGYGSVKRDKIATSIATVKGEDLVKQVASNPAEALQGRAAGVQVLSGGGNPGASPQILIRGITSDLGSAPLLVVDGVMLPAGSSLNFLNAGDIKDFQILKDAAASAIYGSRASNGVVLITTKRGKEGKARINVDFSSGLRTLDRIEQAGADEFVQVMNLRRTNDGLQPILDIDDFTANTDWWDETIENFAHVTNANINISGGSEKIKFAGSVSYFNEESNYTKGWYERVTGRFNVDFNITEKIKLSQDLSPRIERFEDTPGLLYNVLRISPLSEVYLPQSQRTGNIFSIYAPSTNLVPNPVGVASRVINETLFFGFFSNTQLNYQITPSLTFNSQLGLNINNSGRDAFSPTYFTTPNQQREVNTVFRNTNKRFDYIINNTLTFDKTIAEKHYINLLGGVIFDAQNSNFLNASQDGVPDDENPLLRFINGAQGENIAVSGSESQANIFSTIFRGIYSYDNKYTFNASIRSDSSSRFPEDNRTGIFIGGALSWDIDSEEWFNSEVINNLRFKIATGEVGNQNIGVNGRFFSVGQSDFGFNGNRVPTNFLANFGNPDLQWETVRDQNIGLEIGLFNNQFTFSLEAYKRTSEDLLFNVETPNYTGIPGRVAQNVGSFESRGFDLNIGYNKQINDFKMDFNLTLSTNRSVAAELAPGNKQIFGQRRAEFGNSAIKITEEGETVGLFYGFKTLGIFQNQTEINSHSSENGTIIQPDARPGDLIFQDVNGDGVLNAEDEQIIGDPFADFYGGLSANFQYKNFDLSMQWYGTYGNDVYNYASTFLNSGVQDVNVADGALSRVWSPTNTSAQFPRLSLLDENENYTRSSDLFIEDGSYLRLRNIQLGYNFSFKNIKRCRLFISGQNLLTLTNYSGFDPEVAAGGSIINGFGIDYARNPIAKTFLIGLNLNL